MSNFAATSSPIPGRLSPVDETTSEIIDAFSSPNYVFLDVSVGFRIHFSLRFLRLGCPVRLMDSGTRGKHDDAEALRDVADPLGRFNGLVSTPPCGHPFSERPGLRLRPTQTTARGRWSQWAPV